MYSLPELGLDVDLVAEPWRYPGPVAPNAGLAIGDCFHPIDIRPGRRIGQARVRVCERCGRAPGLIHTATLPLTYVLTICNTAPVDIRTLVVAVGSNAAPGVMRGKLEVPDGRYTLPMVPGTVTNLAVGHSAHVSKKGYLAASPYHADGRTSDVVALWLDRRQLAMLDATEPNYVRKLVHAEDYRLELAGGERPDRYYLYESKWGLIRSEDEQVVDFGPQLRLVSLLRTDWPLLVRWLSRGRPEEVLKRLRTDSSLRDRVTEALCTAGVAADSGLVFRDQEGAFDYGHTLSTWQRLAEDLRCGATPLVVDRLGEPLIRMNPADAAALRSPHAVLRIAEDDPRPGVVGRLVVAADVPRGVVEADQTLRNALGVELSEYVEVGRAQVERSRIGDLLLARPHYVVCRVQHADLSTLERDACLLSPLAMTLLGVASGNELVIQGNPGADGAVPEIRLAAHAVPPEAQDLRERLSGGVDTRYPSTRDALGVFPDLPWIFLDAGARDRLGLGRTKLAAVRVRTSRKNQIGTEIRELLVVLAVAFVGLAQVVKSWEVIAVGLAAIIVVMLVAVRSRIRSRLRS